jgi:hypothetical protein
MPVVFLIELLALLVAYTAYTRFPSIAMGLQTNVSDIYHTSQEFAMYESHFYAYVYSDQSRASNHNVAFSERKIHGDQLNNVHATHQP